jgi:hypothetical protein
MPETTHTDQPWSYIARVHQYAHRVRRLNLQMSRPNQQWLVAILCRDDSAGAVRIPLSERGDGHSRIA